MTIKLVVDREKIESQAQIADLCPFQAIEFDGADYSISAACKMCRLCEINGPPGAFTFVEETQWSREQGEWSGIAIFAEQSSDGIHPVVLELLGKARELAAQYPQPIFMLLIGNNLESSAEMLTRYGVDELYLFDHPQLEDFRIEPYAAVFETFLHRTRPAVVLVGATPIGRSLAPRLAARFRTGLTADCTELQIQAECGLIQIRPAFGGNIMARIATPQHRPQFATVRYKVMTEAKPVQNGKTKIYSLPIDPSWLLSGIQVLQTTRRGRQEDITDAEVLVVAGRGVVSAKDLSILEELANALEGQLAATRPMVEKGWLDIKRHIGLSGRTVKPKLIITCGVSGAIQFAAGILNSECIVAINNDPEAPIFQVANFGLVGDLYEIVPLLTKTLQSTRRSLS
ncbi:MAG: electron transfer flavoprotein subunit alpha/FixB family protein [Coprothermobacterota bacterium]|nr:electron transfer flavoprotein subunit alpha/FixB family protein [Coprothermobacterota bacterium]